VLRVPDPLANNPELFLDANGLISPTLVPSSGGGHGQAEEAVRDIVSRLRRSTEWREERINSAAVDADANAEGFSAVYTRVSQLDAEDGDCAQPPRLVSRLAWPSDQRGSRFHLVLGPASFSGFRLGHCGHSSW